MIGQTLITKAPMEKLQIAKSEYADQIRAKYKPQFEKLEMPSERHEDWRYTHINKLKLENFAPFDGFSEITVSNISELEEKGVIITDINSAFESHKELVDNYFMKNIKPEHKFIALNNSHWRNGLFVYVPKNVTVDPIKVNFLVKGKTAISRNLIIAESGSKIDFVEEYSSSSEDECLNSSIAEIHVGDNASVNYSHLNNWKDNVNSFIYISGSLSGNAAINWASASFGGRLNRLRIDTFFDGEGSNCRNLGLFVGKSKEHIDITTNAYHNVPHTTNDIKVDGILKDSSSSVYRGLIKIAKQAQFTNSYLSDHILKLGEKSLGNSIPALEIDANEVKASHGATVGQIDEEHIFYLMSRGLAREQAETMITQGFLEPVICKIPNDELRDKVRRIISK